MGGALNLTVANYSPLSLVNYLIKGGEIIIYI